MQRDHILVSALAAVAWADGVLKAREAKFFWDVVGGLEHSAETTVALLGDLFVPRSVDDIPLEELDDDDRRWLLRFGYLMSHVDGFVDDVELALLQRIAERCGVPWAEALDLFDRSGDLLQEYA